MLSKRVTDGELFADSDANVDVAPAGVSVAGHARKCSGEEWRRLSQPQRNRLCVARGDREAVEEPQGDSLLSLLHGSTVQRLHRLQDRLQHNIFPSRDGREVTSDPLLIRHAAVICGDGSGAAGSDAIEAM